MKLAPIKNLKHGQALEKVSGVIKEVMRPANPSPRQAETGIHPQEITITGEDREDLRIQFLSKDHHLTPATKGKKIAIEASKGDKGPRGLSVNIYKKNEESTPVFRLVADKYVTFRLDEPSQPAAPASRPAQAAEPPARQRQPSLNDHAETLTRLVSLFMEYFNDPDLALRAATTVYIQTARDGLSFSDKSLPGKPQKAENEKAQPSKDEILARIASSIPQGKFDLPKAERAMAAHDIKWERVYDRLAEALSALFDRESVDKAHDELRDAFLGIQSGGSLNDEAFYKSACIDYSTLRDTAKHHFENKDSIPL